jgi:two-component system phosphate regulon response regulator PhoB
MKRVLLIEDDASLGTTLEERLRKEGLAVEWVKTVRQAEKAFQQDPWDLAIVDIGLPDGSGFELAKRIKARSPIPIMFMTALGSAESRLQGFELGAEEFVPKPFHLKELLLRVRHVLETHPARALIRCGTRKIDLDAMAIVREDGHREYPQVRDFQVLKLLLESAPRVVSRNEILDRVWGAGRFPTARTVDNAILRLRQMLGQDGAEAIRSVRGIGYQWAGDELGHAR